MSFTSLEFFIFVLATLVLYYLPQVRRFQVLILVAASLIFYSWDQWRLLPLLVFTVFVTFLSMCGSLRGNRLLAASGIIANLLILCFFKYKFLIIDNSIPIHTSSDFINFLLNLPLPIGISFFVFHNISLIIDSFQQRHNRERPSIAHIFLYIIFFPQLVSGPITKANSFLPQIDPKLLQNLPWIQAAELLILGLFFKLFCANNLAQVSAYMAPELATQSSGADKLFLLFVYSAQIYADFFGYSMMALGLALLFGYRLPVNFQRPYTASSFSDFWNRWHISLSTWLRQYLYIPLGGNRKSEQRTYMNLLLVMVLGGLWHGAALSYAVWGFAHGALLALERYGESFLKKYRPNLKKNLLATRAYSLFVFLCVSLCWLLFRFQEFAQASEYVKSMFHSFFHAKQATSWYLFSLLYMSPVFFQHAFSGHSVLLSQSTIKRGLLFGVLLWLALIERGAETQFIYFRF